MVSMEILLIGSAACFCPPSILVAYHLAMNSIFASSRYAVVVPAIASILGALLLMVQGSIEMIQVIIDAIVNSTKLKLTIVDVLTAVDAILLGTVLLVIGYGLYELFINEDLKVPVWLQVHDLDDLKSKLIGVVVALIAVIFVGVFVDMNRSKDVLAFGVGAGALVTGLAIFAFATKKDPSMKLSRKEAGIKKP